MFLRRCHARTQSDIKPQISHAHFRRGDARQCHDIRQGAKMTDPKHLASDLAKPCAKRDAILFGRVANDLVGIKPVWRPNGADSV